MTFNRQTIFSINPDYPKQEKIPEEQILRLKRQFPSVTEEALFDYWYEYMESSTLRNNLNLSVKYTFADENEVKRQKVGRVIRLSKIGFNKAGTEAFVYAELVACPLCGGADYVLLEKNSGVWKIKEKFNRWVS